MPGGPYVPVFATFKTLFATFKTHQDPDYRHHSLAHPRPIFSRSLNPNCSHSSESSTPLKNTRLPFARWVSIVWKPTSGASSNDNASSKREASKGPSVGIDWVSDVDDRHVGVHRVCYSNAPPGTELQRYHDPRLSPLCMLFFCGELVAYSVKIGWHCISY